MAKPRIHPIPNVLTMDYCPRCGSYFKPGQNCAVVTRGPALGYCPVGLIVCLDCLRPDRSLDHVSCLAVYEGSGEDSPPVSIPTYYGAIKTNGSTLLLRLDDGMYVPAMTEGHVDVMPHERIEAVVKKAKAAGNRPAVGFTKDFAFFGLAASPIVERLVLSVSRMDLSSPEPWEDYGCALKAADHRMYCAFYPECHEKGERKCPQTTG